MKKAYAELPVESVNDSINQIEPIAVFFQKLKT
jgi:hypothetical protein